MKRIVVVSDSYTKYVIHCHEQGLTPDRDALWIHPEGHNAHQLRGLDVTEVRYMSAPNPEVQAMIKHREAVTRPDLA